MCVNMHYQKLLIMCEKINLVGLSLGGILTIDYVEEFPEKVNSIILIGTP